MRAAPVGLFGLVTLQLVDVERPAAAGPVPPDHQVEGVAPSTVVAPEAPSLHVVGNHEGEAAARLEQRPQGYVVDLGSAVHYGHVLRLGAGVEGGDPFAQLRRAVRVRVAQTQREERVEVLAFHQLGHTHGLNAALGQVVLDLVFVQALHAFHLEGLDVHAALLPSAAADRSRRETDAEVTGRGP